jgi:hypothetical protein
MKGFLLPNFVRQLAYVANNGEADGGRQKNSFFNTSKLRA